MDFTLAFMHCNIIVTYVPCPDTAAIRAITKINIMRIILTICKDRMPLISKNVSQSMFLLFCLH